jgi:glucose-1-phosphate cytidylyltransferase
MKVVLLAGGFGTRITEKSQFMPKPMVELGGRPILWHIMKEYSYYGFNDFIICAGYKQHIIKEWFADYFLRSSDVCFDYTQGRNDMTVLSQNCEPWKVTIVNTGLYTMTGGRVKRIQKYTSSSRKKFSFEHPFLLFSFQHIASGGALRLGNRDAAQNTG